MTILEMSLGGGVLIAVILVLRRAALHRLPKWAFLLLWAVALGRLLLPFSLPSQLSVYNRAARMTQTLEEESFPPPAETLEPVWAPTLTAPEPLWEDGWTFPTAPAPAPEKESVEPLTAVYRTGAALCGLFFAAAYLWSLRRFHETEPADCPFLARWQEEHPTLLPVAIKSCGAISAPLAYGLLWRTVLLPETTDWSDEDQLTYVLTHEYVHIRRGDLFWKLLLTAALCVHWFNPLVWLMYLRANQDLELACDEQVIRTLGLDRRKGYAYSLLLAAESGFSPLCITYTTKNHMEERIRAIMKMKKRSLAAILTAALLVAGVTAVFATSPLPEGKNLEDLPHAVLANALPSLTLPTPTDKDKPTTDNRVHPVTGQPAETDVQQPGAAPSQDQVLFPDAMTPNAANFWGFPEGRIEKNIEYFAHNEEDFKEMIRQLRIKGYDGSFEGIGHYRDGRCSVVLSEDFDGVAREISVPNGFMPDWTYPVNTKGETYGKRGMSGWVGYDPDLIGAVATNGQTGYMQNNYGYTGEINTPEGWKAYQAWLSEKPNPWKVPVYDVNRDNIIGYFEVGHQTSSETQAKIDKLKGQENRWGVPNIDPLPLGYMIPAESEQDMWDLIDYLCQSRGLTIYDISHGHNTYDNGIEEWEVTISYQWSREYGGKPPADGKDYYNWPASDVSSIADRWNVPADPIPIATKIQAGTLKDEAELRQYLMQVRGLRAGDMAGCINSSGTHGILITYEQTEREKRLANGYPVNSRGETYGTTRDRTLMGYSPDLILVEATNGLDGYAFDRELQFGDYPGETDTREGFKAFLEWQRTQPSSRLVKVYDVDRNHVIGYFRVADGRDSMTQEEELEMIANQMRNWGNSEEQIAKDLEIYKQSRGWN